MTPGDYTTLRIEASGQSIHRAGWYVMPEVVLASPHDCTGRPMALDSKITSRTWSMAISVERTPSGDMDVDGFAR
jgi:hypothetical protein